MGNRRNPDCRQPDASSLKSIRFRGARRLHASARAQKHASPRRPSSARGTRVDVDVHCRRPDARVPPFADRDRGLVARQHDLLRHRILRYLSDEWPGNADCAGVRQSGFGGVCPPVEPVYLVHCSGHSRGDALHTRLPAPAAASGYTGRYCRRNDTIPAAPRMVHRATDDVYGASTLPAVGR